MIIAQISAFSFAALTSAVSPATAETACPHPPALQVMVLPGAESLISGERMLYESRRENTASGNIRYTYCIANKRKYRVVRVRWYHPGNAARETYIDTRVAPGSFAENVVPSLSTQFATPQRTIDFGGHAVERETLVPVADFTNVSDRAISLASSATLEIAADPKVEQRLSNEKEEVEYKREDYFRIWVEFVSTAKRDASGATEIANGIRIKFLGDTQHAQKSLAVWPKYLRAADPDDGKDLLKSESSSGVQLPPPGAELKGTVVRSTGPVVQRHAVIEITDGTMSFGAFPVSYFGPKP